MQTFIELVFSVTFISVMFYIGYTIFISDRKQGYEHLAYSAFAISISYFIYLVPRILGMLINNDGMKNVLGYTLLFKEIIVTLLLLYLFFILCNRYSLNRKTLNYTMFSLAVFRIIILLLPYNDWVEKRNVLLNILAYLPFLAMGVLLVLLYRQKSIMTKDATLSFFWVVLSLFIFGQTLETFFYSKTYIIYPSLITIFAMFWLLFKDFSLETSKSTKIIKRDL